MIVRIRLNEEAVTDLDEIVAYLGAKGQEFENRLNSTLNGLREMPGKGRPLVSVVNYPLAAPLQNIRFYTVDRFRSYVIYYHVVDQVLLVERILHGARDRDSLLEEQ